MKSVKHYMKKKVLYFRPNDTIFKVAKTFSQHNISGAPVVHKKKIVGVVSDTDLVKHIRTGIPSTKPFEGHTELNISLMIIDILRENLQFKHEMARISKVRLKDIMSKNIISIMPESDILDAAELMEKHDVHRLPVVSKGKLVGIISRSDLIKALID